MKLARRRVVAALLGALATACHDGTAPAKTEPPPCAALCERIAECGPPADFEGVAGCTNTCDEDPQQLSGPCREPRIAYERCMAAAPCEDVRASAQPWPEGTGPCATAREAVLACEPSPPAPFIYFQF